MATGEANASAQEWATQMRDYVRGYLAWCNKIGAAYAASDPEAIGCRPFRANFVAGIPFEKGMNQVEITIKNDVMTDEQWGGVATVVFVRGEEPRLPSLPDLLARTVWNWGGCSTKGYSEEMALSAEETALLDLCILEGGAKA